MAFLLWKKNHKLTIKKADTPLPQPFKQVDHHKSSYKKPERQNSSSKNADKKRSSSKNADRQNSSSKKVERNNSPKQKVNNNLNSENLELFIISLEKVFQKRKREVMLNIRGHVLNKIKYRDSRSKSRTNQLQKTYSQIQERVTSLYNWDNQIRFRERSYVKDNNKRTYQSKERTYQNKERPYVSQSRELKSSRSQVGYSTQFLYRYANPNSISMNFLPKETLEISFGNTTPVKKTDSIAQTLNQSIDDIKDRSVRKYKLEELSDEQDLPDENQNRRQTLRKQIQVNTTLASKRILQHSTNHKPINAHEDLNRTFIQQMNTFKRPINEISLSKVNASEIALLKVNSYASNEGFKVESSGKAKVNESSTSLKEIFNTIKHKANQIDTSKMTNALPSTQGMLQKLISFKQAAMSLTQTLGIASEDNEHNILQQKMRKIACQTLVYRVQFIKETQDLRTGLKEIKKFAQKERKIEAAQQTLELKYKIIIREYFDIWVLNICE